MSDIKENDNNPKTTEDAVKLNLENKDKERGGQKHEPTRHGDWESGGRCTDF